MAVKRRHQHKRLAPDPVDPDALVQVLVRMPAKVRAKARRMCEARQTSLAGLLTDLVLAAEEPPALLDLEEVTTTAA